MQLSKEDFFLLKQCAVSAAFQAGHVIKMNAGRSLHIDRKKTGSSEASSVVTEVDFQSQEVILKILHPTCRLYDLALLTEESTDDKSRFEKDYFWCIDPLDGTLPFIESVDGHSVSIALVNKNGVAEIGVIYNPYTDTLYHAIRGEGAFVNNKSFEDFQPITTNKLLFITDRSFLEHEKFNDTMLCLQEISHSFPVEGVDVLAQGGAAMNAMWCLENKLACYFKFPKVDDRGGSIWDYSASSCICKEVGADVCDIYGSKLELNRRESTFMNHRGFIYSNNSLLTEKLLDFFENH